MSEKKELRGRVILSPELEKKRTQHVRQMEREDCPALVQDAPIAVEDLYEQFYADFDGAWDTYFAKRMEMVGVITRIGADWHGLPSIELSNVPGSRCYALFIARTEELYEGVAVGDTVVCRGNLINAREPFGAVMKKSEVLRIVSEYVLSRLAMMASRDSSFWKAGVTVREIGVYWNLAAGNLPLILSLSNKIILR